jgi:hypothetical protein
VTDAIAKIETIASTRNTGAFPHVTVRPLLIAWAALIGLLGIGWQWDGAQLWIGAQALLNEQDPYAVVPRYFPYLLYYPLPAVLLATPLADLPEPVARILWAALTGAAFAFGVRGPARFAALGAPFLACLLLGHLAPAMMAGAFVPWLGFLWVAKPSLGLALFAAYPSRAAAIGGAALLLVSLALMPDWPLRWLEALPSVPHKPPVLQPFGLVLLLAWWRWDTPAGRLLGTLAFVPHGVYDAVVLFLVCRTRREGMALAGLSLAGAFVSGWLWPWEPGGEVAHAGRFVVALVTLYLPALALVLSRPRSHTSEQSTTWRDRGTTRRAAPAAT